MPNPRPRPELMKGDSGEAVELLQKLLSLPVDGFFGPKTDEAVRNFQLSHGLESDGIVGSMSWKVLDAESPKVVSTSAPLDISKKTIDLNSALNSPDSLISIAIGHAEGNRTVDGGKTGSYFGHIDPGNGIPNKGTFSLQQRIFVNANPGEIFTPEAADTFWLRHLRSVQPKYVSVSTQAGLDPKLSLIAASFFDLFTQSPGAATLKSGFLDRLEHIVKQGIARQAIIHARVQSYFDPDTGSLDAPGFGNSLSRLTADQERRTDALIAVISF